MLLKWLGRIDVIGVEGWPASDHDEPDKRTAKAKLASGLYGGETAEDAAERERLNTLAKSAANTKAARIADDNAKSAEADADRATEIAQNARETADAAATLIAQEGTVGDDHRNS
jgi:hypothetical protein